MSLTKVFNSPWELEMGQGRCRSSEYRADHPPAACQVPGPHGYVPNGGEMCSPRLTHDLAYDFPRSGLSPPREVEVDHNSTHLLL